MNETQTKCSVHPEYKMKRKPACDCLECWKLWAEKLLQESKELRKRVKELDLGC